MRPPLLLLAALVLLVGRQAAADEVVLAGGSRLEGVVLARDASGVELLLPSGQTLTLAPGDVREVLADPDVPRGDKVTRLSRAKDKPRHGLEVALIHLRHPATGRRVDLVGAVHLGDAAYYREVQRLLEAADVVLYEMVRPEEVAPEDAPTSPLREFQQKLAAWFGFQFQLDAISYDRPHFVHADMTMEQFTAGGRKRKPLVARNEETVHEEGPAEDAPAAAKAGGAAPCAEEPRVIPPVALGDPEGETPEVAPAEARPRGDGATKDDAPRPSGLPGALGAMGSQVEAIERTFKAMGADDPTRGAGVRLRLKRAFAGLLGAMAPSMLGLMGEEVSDLILTQRNEVALKVFEGLPPEPRSVAIFYGAAHLPDMEKRLAALGYERVAARWLLAWDLSAPDAAASEPAAARAR